MRILYHHRTASKDGQAVHIQELISAFRRRGHEVIVVGPAFGEPQEFGSESRVVAWLKRGLPKVLYELLELLYSFVAYQDLKSAYLKYEPDLLYERYNIYLLAGCWLHRQYQLPYLLEVNSPLYEERVQYGGIRLRSLARWTQRVAWKTPSRVLPVSQVLSNYILAEGISPARVLVIPNGINIKTFMRPVDQEAAKRNLGLSGKIVLGFTGFVREWHGLGTVIQLIASDQSRNLHLLIVGDGPGRQLLVAQAEQLGVIDRVTFTGVVNHDAVVDHAAAFDIALQPSVTPYASPLKLFEYMALGRAIVAPKTANIEEVLTDGDNALLFTVGDEDAFRAQVERLCIDLDLRERIGVAARHLIEERQLTWDNNVKRIESLFEKIIAERDHAE